MKITSLYLSLIACFCINCTSQVSKTIENISASTFAEKIKETTNPMIVDVRTPEEFANQHIDNAININWRNEDFIKKTNQLDKQKPIFIYCLSGGRSKLAADKLSELGFSKIYNLQGGILKWNSAGIDSSNDKIIGICSQEYEEMLNSDKKILVNFYAEWCAPCKKMAPYISKMQTEMADTLVVLKFNADENKTILKELKIDVLPTLILYKNKKVIWKHSGFIDEEDLKTHLQNDN